MAATAVVGLTTGQRLLSSSIYSSDLSDKLLHSVLDHGSAQLPTVLTRKVIVAKKNANFSPKSPSRPSKREKQAIRAVKEHITTTTITTTTTSTFYTPSIAKDWFDSPIIQDELQNPDMESSLEAIILLQKAMLEKQWNLSFDQSQETIHTGESIKKTGVIRSGVSARKRRNLTRRKCLPGGNSGDTLLSTREERGVSHDLLHNQFKGYIRGRVRVDHLSHADVVQLSKKIRAGLSVEEHKKRLKVKLGCEPSDQQLAASLRISCVELQSKLMECSLAREKLAMSNVRLVMAIAQKYDNMGADLADLIQGGLIGLLRGIEKFDSSKGFRISTYVYWWIRQGVSRALVDNSRTLRLPSHIHERLSSIRTAKTKLEESRITPTIAKIAEVLNMSEKKIRNAAEAATRVFSLDRDAFPSLNGLPGETFHSYIADTRLENNPWHGFEEWSLKDEVNTLLNSTLGEREQEIIRLYHGLESECQSWEEISRQIGLSRERVRQVGLVAMEKLKHAARRKKLEAMLVKH